jgi:hypothetical protein
MGRSISDGDFIMDDCRSDLQMLRARMTGIGERLDGAWAEKLREHLHLDRNTTECAYWHSGYHQALADALELISKARSTFDISGKSNQRLAAG